MPALVLPALAVALVAMLAVIAFFGAETFGHIVAHLIPGNIPIVGDRIRNAVDGFAQRSVTALKAYVAVKIAPFADLVKFPAAALRVHLSTILDTLTGLGHNQAAIIRAVIPAEINKVALRLLADIARTDAYIKTSEAALAGELRADIARTDAYIRTSEAALAGELRGEVAHLAGYVDSRVTDVARALRGDIARTDAALTAAAAGLLDQLHGAESTLAGLIGQAAAGAVRAAEGAVTADVLGPWGLAWPDISGAVTGLEGVIADDLPQLGALIRSLPRELPADLAGTVGITAALSTVLLRYLRDCGVPNCRNLGKFGRDLQELLRVVEGGSLLGLVAAAARDPAGTGRAVVDVLGPVVSEAAGQARAMVASA